MTTKPEIIKELNELLDELFESKQPVRKKEARTK